MELPRKILFPIIILVIVALFATAVLHSHQQIRETNESVLASYDQSMDNIDQMQHFMFYQAELVPEYLTQVDVLPVETFQSNFSNFVRYYQDEYARSEDQTAKDYLYLVSVSYYKFADSFSQFQSYVEAGDLDSAYYFSRLTLMPDINSAYTALNTYRKYVEEQHDAFIKTIPESYFRSSLMLAALFALLGIAVIVVARRYINKRLQPMQDIMEEKQQFEESRSQFFASVSHELKTPLTSIVMGAELLQNPMIGDLNDDQQELVSTILEDSFTMTTLITNMLQMTKSEPSQAVYLFEVCDFLSVLQQSVSGFERIAEKKHVRLSFASPPSLPSVRVDRERMNWVMNNLLSNAFKYSEAGDTIHIAVEETGGETITVRISDQGPGVPAEYKEKIFEKYFRVDEDETELGGTGLGLAICREIVTAHGGTIWHEDNHPRGAVFSFTIPVNRD